MEIQPIRRVAIYTPIVMSLIAFAIVLPAIGMNPANYPKDEGWQAHLWQLLMALQVPLILLFVGTSRRSLARNLPIVALQLTLLAANFLLVYLLKL